MLVEKLVYPELILLNIAVKIAELDSTKIIKIVKKLTTYPSIRYVILKRGPNLLVDASTDVSLRYISSS